MDHQTAAEFGRFLKARRGELGLTTRKLAELASVNQATVVRLEAGAIAEPRPDKLRRLAEALDMSTSELHARAGYAAARDLPGLNVYLRGKFRDLSPQDVEQIGGYIEGLLRARARETAEAPALGTLDLEGES